MITIRTTDKPRTVKQAITALLKSWSISEGYKLNYAKHYYLTEQNNPTTNNVQILLLVPQEKREKVWKNILDNTLEHREEISHISR